MSEMMSRMRSWSPILLLLLCSLSLCRCGLSKERASDGAFSPRDASHFSSGHDANFDRQAILGSSKEAASFDDLSPEEAKARLKELLLKMDRNQDKHVDRDELFSWILRSFRKLSKEESEERMADADANNDTKVTWEEYVAEEFDDINDDNFDDLSDEEKADRLEELALMEEDKVLFLAADRDNNGYLDSSEFLSFTHPEEDPEMHPVIVQRVLQEKDANKDGVLDFAEYLGQRGKEQSKDWLVGERDRFDNELDKDKDGFLGRPEIVSWLVPSNDAIAKDEVDHLMAGADVDVDGKLSFEEILDNVELFLGSEATDYGQHLHNVHHFTDEL